MIRQAVPIRAELPIRPGASEGKGISVKKLLSVCLPAAGCLLAAGLVGLALIMTEAAALAHHSFSMFEYGSSTEIEGTVQEFRYVNPPFQDHIPPALMCAMV